jgi:RNA polymerase sigma factor (sigma-70 family)
VKVDAGVYAAYAQGDRRERYQTERIVGRILSLERMEEDGVLLSYLTDEHIPSAEDTVLQKMDSELLSAALGRLPPHERSLIHALFIDGMTERNYASRIGISQKNVNRKKQRILQKLKKSLLAQGIK